MKTLIIILLILICNTQIANSQDSVIWVNPSDSVYINKDLTLSKKEFNKPKTDWLEGLENTGWTLGGTVVFGIADYILYRNIFMKGGNMDLYRYIIQPALDITIGYALYKISGDNIKVSIGYGLLRLGGWGDEVFYNIHGLNHTKYGGNFNPTASHLWWTFPTGLIKKDITVGDHQFNLGFTLSINYLLQTL